MSLDLTTLVTILLMATVTYASRLAGWLVLRDRALGPRAALILDAVPGAVLMAVIAPYLTTGRPADLIAFGVTALAAMRLPVLPTVVVGVATAALARHLLP